MIDKFVGPFFLISGKVYALKVSVVEGEVTSDFVNHPKSHFDYFQEIPHGLYDDYGNYPRGRVVFNKVKNVFYIYADKKIVYDDKIIKQIKQTYNLENERVLVRRDSHYTHDNL